MQIWWLLVKFEYADVQLYQWKHYKAEENRKHYTIGTLQYMTIPTHAFQAFTEYTALSVFQRSLASFFGLQS